MPETILLLHDSAWTTASTTTEKERAQVTLNSEDAALSANKILTALRLPHRVKEHDLQITVSMGIGIYPEDGTDAETLVKNADIARFVGISGAPHRRTCFERPS